MTTTSALESVYIKGTFGDYEGKNEKNLLNISENKNLLIIQIAQYKNSTVSIGSVKIDNLNLVNKALNVSKIMIQEFYGTDLIVGFWYQPRKNYCKK